jgi:hypothetical protein
MFSRRSSDDAMTRNPRRDLFGSTHTQPAVLEAPRERRSVFLESLLCIAIRKRVLVKLQFKEYIVERLFEPTVVYLSKKHQICVAGIQIANLEKPLDDAEVRNFDIGAMRNVLLTEQAFVIDPIVDQSDCKYANGIICSIY